MDRDERNEFKEDLNDISWMARRVSFKIAAFLIVLTIICSTLGLAKRYTFDKWFKDADRYIFKSSVAYNEQAASFLAKSYKEYNEAETPAEKSAIMEYVVIRYPNLDISSIENAKLRSFYLSCID